LSILGLPRGWPRYRRRSDDDRHEPINRSCWQKILILRERRLIADPRAMSARSAARLMVIPAMTCRVMMCPNAIHHTPANPASVA
jgi:hypothetical protein